MQYDLSHPKSLALLQKRAKFTYLEKYCGKASRLFKSIFKKQKFKKLQDKYSCQPIVVAQIAALGHRGLGVIATRDLHVEKGKKTTPLGIYWGELALESPHRSDYIFAVSHYEVDAKKQGNWTRFVNHSHANYNVIAIQKVSVIENIRLPYIEYALVKDVKAGQQLLVDYGPEYEFSKKHQIFLNPSNGPLCASDIYAQYHRYYKPIKGRCLMACRELMPKATLVYGPVSSFGWELPILMADKRGRVIDDPRQQPGITVLMLAAYMGDARVVQTLIRQGRVNPNQQNVCDGHTALFYAIQGHAKPTVQEMIVACLLKSGVHLSAQDAEGHTIFHLCAQANNLRILELLFANKKEKSNAMEAFALLDREGFCVVSYAISLGSIKIAQYLLGVYEKHHKIKLFHSKNNDRFIQGVRKSIRKCPADARAEMKSMLLDKGWDASRKVRR